MSSPESPEGRALVMKALREMFAMIESTGVPRHVLMDVISACLRDMGGGTKAPSHSAATGGARFEARNTEFDPEADSKMIRKQMDRTVQAMKLLDPVLLGIFEKFDPGIAMCALASQLSRMLVDFNDQGAGGAAIAQGVLDGLMQTVKTGRPQVTEVTLKTEH